jgi:alkylhydroperoxidase/carboxymuconolactone decarboxylase family protein YurZ
VNTVPRAAGASSHALPAPPQSELVLGRFRLIERLGSGGHGTVWEAYDERLRRTVALKRIACAHDASGEDHRRIDREALAAARLSHPAIVAFHEALSDHDAYYLVSEIVRGASLAKRYAGARPRDSELIAIGLALADGLAHAHARGVIHRDVKPQNVIIAIDASETGAHAKLTDFGVAQIAGEQPLTRTGDVVGTLAYMAPEQADGRQVSPATDLYALALTLYEGFAGENPLRGATAVATVKRLSEGICPLAERRPDLPRRLARAIDRALSIDPAERGSLGDLRDALASLAGGSPRRAATLRQQSPRRPTELTRRAKRLIAGAGLAALSVAALPSVLDLHTGAPIFAVASIALLAGAFAPRAAWLILAFAAVASMAIAGQLGTALLLAVAFAPLPCLLAADPWMWSLPALAPMLGLVGVAAAFPALAARAGGSSSWRRAALGAVGYWWVALTEALTGHRLLLGAVGGARPRASWDGSIGGALTHVVGPLCTPGRLAPAALWAFAALVLPWALSNATGLSRALRAAAWATGLIVAGLVLAHRIGAPQPPLPLAAALLALAVALSLRRARLRVSARSGVT